MTQTAEPAAGMVERAFGTRADLVVPIASVWLAYLLGWSAYMRILMVASEVVPFAKTGGLADVVGTLPRFLKDLGHDVRVVMPRYREIDPSTYDLLPLEGPLGVPMGVLPEHWCSVLEGRLPRGDVPIYFIDFNAYFGRTGLYNEPSGQGYMDNDRRFVFLSRAALQLCHKIGFAPQVVHVNDWHTAAIPALLNTVYARDPLFAHTASVLTIHNMQYQGRYYPGLMDVLGIGWNHFNHLEFEWNGTVNLLKGGLYHATLLNAVSPGYAREIATKRFGHGLEGVIQDRQRDLRGIVNGIDEEEWNPGNDPHIAAPYSGRDLRGKAACKRALQRELGLPVREDVPIIGMITRLVHQKGIDVLAATFERLMHLDLQIVLLGSGEPWSHAFFKAAAARYPERFACRLGYDHPLSHRIEAGADFFLMPSRFEPCGLNQMYSLRYGTLPIVHAVGGLDDTVESLDEHAGEGTGFKFYDLTPSAIFNTVGWALHTYYNHPETITTMRRAAMAQRLGWERSARRYTAMFTEAARRKSW